MARSAHARGAVGFHLSMVWANARRRNRLHRFVTQLLQGGLILLPERAAASCFAVQLLQEG